MTKRANRLYRGVREDQSGSLVIIVMMFTMVFLGMGVGLFYLIKMNVNSVDVERKDTKSFNVAEAGLDAGMLELRGLWPDTSGQSVIVDETDFRSDFSTADFPNPSRSPASDFIEVVVYDNSSGNPTYDANADNLMYVDAQANVDDARHRIRVLAQRQTWDLAFPLIAMYAGTAGANGQGLRVRVDPAQTEPLPEYDPNTGDSWVSAYYGGPFGKGVDLPPDGTVKGNPNDPGSFEDWVDANLLGAVKGIAQSNGTYFTSAVNAETLLTSTNIRTEAQGGDAAGEIVYLETTSATIEVGGNSQMGTMANPVVLVLDVPSGSSVALDFKGTADFYGILVCTGDIEIRGTSTFYGSVIVKNLLESKGNGSVPEVHYNGNIVKAINDEHTISVNILPNTWEEYTVSNAAATTTTAP